MSGAMQSALLPVGSDRELTEIQQIIISDETRDVSFADAQSTLRQIAERFLVCRAQERASTSAAEVGNVRKIDTHGKNIERLLTRIDDAVEQLRQEAAGFEETFGRLVDKSLILNVAAPTLMSRLTEEVSDPTTLPIALARRQLTFYSTFRSRAPGPGTMAAKLGASPLGLMVVETANLFDAVHGKNASIGKKRSDCIRAAGLIYTFATGDDIEVPTDEIRRFMAGIAPEEPLRIDTYGSWPWFGHAMRRLRLFQRR